MFQGMFKLGVLTCGLMLNGCLEEAGGDGGDNETMVFGESRADAGLNTDSGLPPDGSDDPIDGGAGTGIDAARPSAGSDGAVGGGSRAEYPGYPADGALPTAGSDGSLNPADPTDPADGAGGTMADAGTPPASATFTEVNDQVLSARCATIGCHGAFLPQRGLDLQTDPYEAIVDVMSSTTDDLTYVVPGDPEASFLYQKIATNSPPAGLRMPPLVPLNDESIELVRSWIAGGALDN